MSGLLLCDDLLFSSRVTGIARDLGLEMSVARSTAELSIECTRNKPCCVIVDLAMPDSLSVGLLGLMSYLRENCTPMPRVVAYGSHVDTEALRKAREAGCDPVLPRSKFVEELPKKLREWMER